MITNDYILNTDSCLFHPGSMFRRHSQDELLCLHKARNT
jgi:hypothetical protein